MLANTGRSSICTRSSVDLTRRLTSSNNMAQAIPSRVPPKAAIRRFMSSFGLDGVAGGVAVLSRTALVWLDKLCSRVCDALWVTVS